MVKCKLCGKVFPDKDRRAFNAHLVRQHPEEYKGKKMEEMTDDPVPARVHDLREKSRSKKRTISERKKAVRAESHISRPEGFRLLNAAVEEEAYAISKGFRYIDDTEECYSSQDAEQKGWV